VRIGESFTLRGDILGIWERPWGLRRPYYDYLTVHGTGGGPELGHPGDDTLPPLLEADVGFSWRGRVGDAGLELHATVRNVLNRANVLDRSLALDPGAEGGGIYRPLARRLPGIMPLLSIRVTP
jgi:hypothetical protein